MLYVYDFNFNGRPMRYGPLVITEKMSVNGIGLLSVSFLVCQVRSYPYISVPCSLKALTQMQLVNASLWFSLPHLSKFYVFS